MLCLALPVTCLIGHSTDKLAPRTTFLPHFSVSETIILPKSSGGAGHRLPPSSISLALIAGSGQRLIDGLVQLVDDLRRRTLRRTHAEPGAGLIALDGLGERSAHPGNASRRSSVVTRERPQRAGLERAAPMAGILSNITCTWPAQQIGQRRRASRDTARAAIFTPVIAMNSSPDRCTEVPLPDDAMLTLPGLAFTYSMNSATVLAGHRLVARSSRSARG